MRWPAAVSADSLPARPESPARPASLPPPLVYVSYAWRSRAPAGQDAALSPSDDREAIVDELCQVLDQEERLVVGRDKKLLKTGDSILDFAREIASGGLILAVISHKSLRSDWCMVHELLQAFRRRNFDPGSLVPMCWRWFWRMRWTTSGIRGILSGIGWPGCSKSES
jgi:hypothetical protein